MNNRSFEIRKKYLLRSNGNSGLRENFLCNRIQDCLLQERLSGQILFLGGGDDDDDSYDKSDKSDDDNDDYDDADDDDEDGDNDPRLSFAGGTRTNIVAAHRLGKKCGENKNTQDVK